MKYTKRHYEDVARLIGLVMADHNTKSGPLLDVASDFVTLFAGDNPRFNRDRFLAAVNDYADGAKHESTK